MQKRSFILGIIAIVTAFIPFICFVSPIIAIIAIVAAIIGATKENKNLWMWALALAIISFPISALNSFIVTPIAAKVSITDLISKSLQERKYRESQDIIAAPPPESLVTYELPVFLKNTTDAKPHSIKMTISLAYVADKTFSTELVTKKDEIIKTVDLLLQEKSYDELNSVSGAITLSEEIKNTINKKLIAGKIKEINYKEYTVK